MRGALCVLSDARHRKTSAHRFAPGAATRVKKGKRHDRSDSGGFVTARDAGCPQ
jgi:hypothetical protein